jgi:hypothetical protein
VECIDDTISMKWIKNLNTKIDHLTFELGGQQIWARYKNHATFKVYFVTRVNYAKVMVKSNYSAFIAKNLISKLGNCFLFHELMGALGTVYH